MFAKIYDTEIKIDYKKKGNNVLIKTKFLYSHFGFNVSSD